jgi:glycosyltransferase involved in cell wall biosynthesis
MKVAVVYYQLTPEGGGVHTFTQSIHAALRAAADESPHDFVYYATATPEGPPPGVIMMPAGPVAAAKKRTIQRLRDAQDRLGAPRFGPPTWFEGSLAEHGVDLVWFATNYAEDCDQPFIFTVFDVEHVRQPWFPEVSAAGEWERRHYYFSRYIPKATRVIVPNAAGRDQVERYWRIEPDRFLLLQHPTPAFALEASAAPAPPRDALDRRGIGDRYLLYPAQFWAHKNHATLFEALALLEPGYELVLVGSDKGQLEHHRRLAAETGVGDRVHFLGFVPTEELVALYRHAHALTYVSLFGPENLPPLEAMALGCPVVAADVPGAKEQLGDAALRVPPLDPAAIADAVRRLDEPAERDRLVAAGRERAASSSAEDYVGGVLRFINDFERVRRTWA